jgi:hypothetical protein
MRALETIAVIDGLIESARQQRSVNVPYLEDINQKDQEHD